MFALLAWNGAFAQTEDERLEALEAVEDGATYRILTDVNGTKYYVTTEGLLTSVKNDAGFFTITKTSGGNFGTGFRIDSGSKRFTNPPLSNNVANLTPGAFATTDGDRADWERQILYLNSEDKYAIRSCNVADGTSSWNDAGRTYWTYSIDPVTPCYSYDPAYVWELEVPPAIINVTYEIYDEGENLVGSATVKQEANSEISIPADLKNFAYDYEPLGTIGDTDCTIRVNRSFKSGVVHALSDLSNEKAYTIRCDRGALLTKDNYLASTAHSTLKAAEATEFAVISYEENYYLFSVADKMFVTYNGALAAMPTHGAEDAIKMDPKTDPYFMYYFTIGGSDNGLNTNGNDPYGYVINSWMTADPGNLYYMIESSDFDPAEAIAGLESYFHPSFFVTYVVKDTNGNVLYSSEPEPTVLGSKITTLPAELQRDFFTYNEVDVTISEEETTVEFTATWNGPFELADTENFNNAKWYNMTIRGNYWVGVDESEPYYPKADKNLQRDENQWAFVLGANAGLTIYNRAYGNTATLAVDGNNVVMREGEPFEWDLFSQADGFVLREPGTATRYVNQNGGSNGPLQFWDSASGRTDNGSTFRVSEVVIRTIESDITAQFPLDYQGWTGATGFVGWAAPEVTTNDGRQTPAAERYEGTCENTGVVFSRTLTGLANGTYKIGLFGAAAYTSGRGFESELEEGDETAVYLYAETTAGTVKQYIPAHVADNFNGTGIATAELPQIEVTDGTLTIGMYKEKPLTNWHVVQIKGVTAVARFIDVADAAEADYEATNGKVMEQTAADAMANTKAAFDANDTDENLTAFQNAVAAAKASAEAYANAAEKLQAMEELVAKTNFYTEDAYNEYYGNWQVKYDERTLTTEEANALQNPNVVTGWHAALTVDNFLLSVWDAEPDFASNYYINSWSVEGDNDGTGFRVPFFEYWTGDGDSLGERELTAQLEGLAPGNYAVNVWARVRVKNGEDMDAAHGITLSANDGEPVDVTTGEIVGQFRLAQFTANGVVGEDGVLTVKFNVAADNDISWLSFKNVKYVATADINTLTGSFAQVDNAKLAKSWVSTDSTFVLSCPLNFMTAASLGGGAWNSVRENLADPYIGFYSNESYSDGQAGDGNFTVTAPDGVQITALVINASILKGAPTLSAEGIDEVTLTKEEQSITIPFDKVQSATFHVGGDAAWMKATIQVQFEGAIASQGTPSVTGIASVNTVNAEGTIFNMAGQRVNKALKGIYIINGKKVVK